MGGGHTVQYAELVTQKPTPETCVIQSTNVTLTHLTGRKNTKKKAHLLNSKKKLFHKIKMIRSQVSTSTCGPIGRWVSCFPHAAPKPVCRDGGMTGRV